MEFEAEVQGFGYPSSHPTGLSFSNFHFDCVLHRNPCDYFGSSCDGFLCHVFNYVLAAAMLVPIAPEAGEGTVADLAGGQLTEVAAGGTVREAGGILANQAAGNAVRNAIAAEYPGSAIEATFTTPLGVRRIDVLTEQGFAIESKVGRVSLTTDIQNQIAKDQWLLAHEGDITAVRWVFTRSEVTGEMGPTGPLQAALNQAGISWVVRP